MATSVLHVCDKFGVAGSSIHGVSRLFSWWFPRYSDEFDVSLCGLKSPEPASRWLASQGIPVTHLGRGPFDPRIVADLYGLARRRQARILHVHGYAAADFGRIVARMAGARVVLHEHFADPRMPAYQGLADRALARFTDRAIAVSESTREFLVKQRRVPRERIRLVYNGAPLGEFTPTAATAEAAAALRASIGFLKDDVVVASVGRLNLQKGHRYLLDAAPAVLDGRPRLRFLIVGDGDQLEPLKEQARALDLGERIVFLGHRTDIPAILAATDVFCISSTYEGTPLTLFEAMAAGKAIVSTAVDGCREVLENDKTGLLVPSGDAQALADALRQAIDSPERRAALARNARHASTRYDIDECMRRIEAVYHELTERINED